jgi:hypothetical protein
LIEAPLEPILPDVDRPSPDCRRCAHYYITYETQWPHGCRAFELKSARLPHLVVLENSGAHCQGFTERESGQPGGPE